MNTIGLADAGRCKLLPVVRASIPKMASNMRRPNLAREIAIVLAVKFLALFLIWSVWFAHPETSRLESRNVAASVYSPPVAHQESESDAKP
jgi:hypothetical protein